MAYSQKDIEAVARAMKDLMGPVVGSPEYLADDVKRARAEKRQADSARQQAITAIDALTAAGWGPAEEGWKPMETAPRDGTVILGAYFDQPWADSHMNGQIARVWFQPEFDAFISRCNQMFLARGMTFENGLSHKLHSPEIERVTHWTPLPAPPATETSGRTG
jgi:hypothetical protein